MNRIVRERYPVSKLPRELRQEFEGQEFVDIISTPTQETREAVSAGGETSKLEASETALGGQFSRFKHLRRSNYNSSAEVDDYVSALRDEWAHRER